MNTGTHHEVYNYPDCHGVVICGDIHGDFNLLVNKVCVQYQMRDTLVIVAGDCGFGFERKGYYENIVRRNAKRMNECNNWFLFIRGNHDNPAYFDGKTFRHKRFTAIPDYSVVKANGHTILCVGGAISIDRQSRKEAWERNQRKMHRFGHNPDNESLAPNYYWHDEAPVLNEELLSKITAQHHVDTVVTHTAPSFCELQDKNGLQQWAVFDESLKDDVQKERETMDAIYDYLKTNAGGTLSHWYYGHFHQSWYSSIDGVLFKMLDIMELAELTP